MVDTRGVATVRGGWVKLRQVQPQAREGSRGRSCFNRVDRAYLGTEMIWGLGSGWPQVRYTGHIKEGRLSLLVPQPHFETSSRHARRRSRRYRS